MSSLEERVASLEQQIIDLREELTDTRTLAAHADRDVAEFRTELRDQTRLLNATRLDMNDLRQETGAGFTEIKSEIAELKGGIAHIVTLLQGMSGGEGS